MRILIIISLLVLASISASAQTNKKLDNKLFAVSSATYWAGTFADWESSQGRIELTPTLRNKQGEISGPKYFGIAAGVYAVTLFLERRHSRVASILRFTFGGGHFVAAAHNYHTR
ncbi:MAG: hypothetical protein ABJB61_15135 [bacterium]